MCEMPAKKGRREVSYFLIYVHFYLRILLLIVVPRVLFDSWTQEHAIELVGGRIKEMAIKFITLCDQGKFDGLVLEVWNQLADRLNRHDILELIKRIGKKIFYIRIFCNTILC